MYINKKACLALGAIVCATTVSAQKKMFTMAEATNGMSTTLAPASLKQAAWEPGTNKLYYVVKTGNGDAWVSVSFPAATVDTVLRLKELAKGEKLKLMPALTWVDKGLLYFKDGNDLKEGVRTGNGVQWSTWATLPENAENLEVHKTRNIYYTSGNNLCMITKDKKKLQVTNDANEHIVNGQSVHRNEFGITGGIFPSPDGNYLAYYRMDESMVNDYPVVDWSATPAKVKNIKYPMSGGTSHQVTVRVFNPTTRKTVTINTEGPQDQYLTSVTWSPDEKTIFIGVLNREQNHLVLNQYDAQTGAKLRTLFEEKDDKYVEPQHGLTFIPESNDEFIWWSQRDGFMHLYLYRTNGKLVRQLTKGNWVVNEVLGFNKASNEVIVTAAKETPLEKHAYAVSLNNSSIRRLDKEAGTHTVALTDDGKYIFDVVTGAGIPKRSTIRAVAGKYENTLLEAANPLQMYNRPEVRNIELKADDGTPLYGKLILPVNFDASKKYPTIVYLYNGPHVQLIKNSFPESGNLWYEYMAQHGYVVFSMDGRGSGNRGLKFEQAIFRKLGTIEMDDQMKGVEYLMSQRFVDKERMGIHGWSYGGFMTTSFMLRNPDIFKCGVAGGPVLDWTMYEIMYTERYMDTPKENPTGYADNLLLDKIKNLKGKLLLIHGTDDPTVVWQHSVNMLKKAVDNGVQLDYFVYPGHEHNVRGKDRVHLMQKITDYFDQHLK
jgi:Dipeptidyl aminopeptidases/acylaminoacyl-peptidases